MDKAVSAPVIEVFSSLQGEGPHVGERHLFVRFQDCELTCKFCDTPLSFVENRFCRVEYPPFSKRFQNIPNPIAPDQLNEILSGYSDRILVLTGGEPLQKAAFLKNWLPTARLKFRLLLETAGVHVSEFREIADWIDIVSMDFKLPSVTGMHPWWREHEAFLRMALDLSREVYVKAVVSSEMQEEDLLKGIDLIASLEPSIPLILQPASPFGRFRSAPTLEQLSRWQDLAAAKLQDVRVIPQLHKQLGIL